MCTKHLKRADFCLLFMKAKNYFFIQKDLRGKMCNGNYIKLSRNLLDWGWYKDANTSRVFLHCLLKANWKDGEYYGVRIPRGSFVSSYAKLYSELNLSLQAVRTSMKHLISTNEVTNKGYSKFSVFTVVKYSQYQEANKESNLQTTKQQHTASNNRKKKEMNHIYSEIPELQKAIHDFIEHRKKIKAPMTDRAICLMIKKLNALTPNVNQQIKILNQSIEMGWKGIFDLKENKVKKNQFNRFEYQRHDAIDESLLISNK